MRISSPFIHSHKYSIALISVLISLLVISNVAWVASVSQNNNEQFKISGVISIYKDGVLVLRQPDLIQFQMYDYIICKTWNDSGTCSSLNSVWYHTTAGTVNGCTSYSTSGTADHPSQFTAATRCSALTAMLSNDNTAPTTSATGCANGGGSSVFTASGMGPVKAVINHVLGTNSLTFTATWTASGSVSGITKACIGMWNDFANTFTSNTLGISAEPILIADTFAAQSVSSSQNFQVIWTISF